MLNPNDQIRLMQDGRLILRPRKLSLLLYLLGCLAFTAIGVFMINAGRMGGWLPTIFFGLGVIVFIVMMLPGSSYLELTGEGFTVCSLYRRSFTRWSDVDSFFVGRIQGKVVMFNFAPTYTRQQTARRVSVAIAGGEGALPDTYGRSAEELAQMMNILKLTHTKP